MFAYSLQWLGLALDAAVKSLLLALIATLLIRALRIRDSQVRHRIWTGVLVGMLMLPLLSQVVPQLQLPLFVPPEWLALVRADEFGTRPDVATSQFSARTLPESAPPVAEAMSLVPETVQQLDAEFRGGPSAGAGFLAQDPASTSEPRVLPDAVPIGSHMPFIQSPGDPPQPVAAPSLFRRLARAAPYLLAGVWLLGSLIMLARLALGLAAAWRLNWASTPILEVDLNELGLASDCWPSQTRTARLLECPMIRVPLTIGLFRPVVMLPLEWLEWSTAKLEAVLLHERTHVERGDSAIALLAEVNVAVNWFNPLSWWLRHRLSTLAEEACDDAAIICTGDRTTYARHLLEVAAAISDTRGRILPTSVSMARRSDVESRIDSILDFARPLSQRPTWATTLVILALATPVIGLAAALRPSRPNPVETAIQVDAAQPPAGSEVASLVALADAKDEKESGSEAPEDGAGNDAKLPITGPSGDAATEPQSPAAQPIRGRLIDTEGRPVKDATIRVVDLYAASSAKLGDWIVLQRREAGTGGASRTVMTMNRQNQVRAPFGPKVELADVHVAQSDATGRFEIEDVGADRIAVLRIDKPGIATALVDVIMREMEPLRVDGEHHGDRRIYYGMKFDYVVEPDAPLAGRLTDVDSGAPIPNARINAGPDETSSDRRKLAELTATTDADGRYEIRGLPQRRGNRMYVDFTDQTYLDADSLTIPKPTASGTTAFDVTFKRGVWVSGVVKDQAGQPVKGKVCYTPFANNEFIKQHPRYSSGVRRMLQYFPSGETDAEGKYRILVIQGHGIVCFQAADKDSYVAGFGKEAIPDLQDSKVDVIDHGLDVSFHALKEITPAADADEVKADLEVDTGRMITFRFADPAGQPLTTVRAGGLKTRGGKIGETAELRFTTAEETQCLLFSDETTGLRSIVRFTAGPEQKEATVVLHPPARLTGRLLDLDHQPLKDVPLDSHFSPQPGWVSSPPFAKNDPPPVSDQDGRFTMLLPAGEKLSIFIRSRSGVAKLLKGDLIATAGETIDLGDLEINPENRSDAKPLQPEKRMSGASQASASDKKSAVVAAASTVQPSTEANASSAASTNSKEDPVFRYSGTVVDESGKPIAGATVTLHYGLLRDIGVPQSVATTDAQGKFELSRQKSQFADGWEDAWSYATLVAVKPGYGLAAGHSRNFETTGSLRASLSNQMRRAAETLFGRATNVLKLPADLPIQGRIITPDGKPVAGATITPYNADEGMSGSLEEWEKSTKETGANYYTARQKLVRLFGGDFVNGPIDHLLPPVTTDADGRFTLSGLGRERLARVFVTGPGIEAGEFYVRSRAGETIKLSDSDRGEDGWFKTYYPAEFTHVAGPSQPVTGVVTDLKTGKPLAGFFVRAERTTTSRVGGNSSYIRATTDEEGRFTLNGFPLGGGNEFVVLPPKGSKYLAAGVSFKTALSAEPLVKNVPLTEGVVVRGKVTDAKTGKPVQGYAEYFVFTDNPALEQTKNYRNLDQRHMFVTDSEGRFEIPVLPGPGIVTFWANDFQTYPRGAGRESITGKNASIGGAMYAFSTWPHHVMADNCSSLTQVDPASDAKSVDLSITLTPTQTFSVRVVSADGRVPTEFFRYGESSPASWSGGHGGPFTVTGYISEYGRRLMAFEPSTDLIGKLDVTGEPPADALITLEPATRFIGRLVDENGAPLPETRIEGGWRSASEPNAAMMNDRRWRGGFELERGEFVPLKGRAVITDENGRFEMCGIMPGLKYSAQALGMQKFGNQSYLTSLGKVLDDVVAKPGPVNDLGDVVLKPEKPE